MEKLSKIVQSHVGQLEEHFDCVHIFCSNLSDGGEFTHDFSYGGGNIHTRINLAHQFVVYQNELVKAKARKDEDEED